MTLLFRLVTLHERPTWPSFTGLQYMIQITDNLFIPESEISFVASRSGGPGGQNVNKVSSRVTLSFDVHQSTALSEDQKEARPCSAQDSELTRKEFFRSFRNGPAVRI